MRSFSRRLAAVVSIGLLVQPLPSSAAYGRVRLTHPAVRYTPAGFTSMKRIRLLDGRFITVGQGGMTSVFDAKKKLVETRWLSARDLPVGAPGSAEYQAGVRILTNALAKRVAGEPYAHGRLLVVLKDGTTSLQDDLNVSESVMHSLRVAKSASARHSIAPRYTSDGYVNAAFADIGVSRVHRLFSSVDRAVLSGRRAAAQARMGRQVLNIANAYRLDVSHSSVPRAVAALRKLPNVAYVSPDFAVSPMHPSLRALPEAERAQLRSTSAQGLRSASHLSAAGGAAQLTAAALPTNFGTTSSLQSMLDSSGIDSMAAYQEIQTQFHQLPGTGEIITNVSIGDIFAAEDGQGLPTPGNPCPYFLQAAGPMTQMINGQRYINWPGMPLIPAYAADANGHIDSHYVSCGTSDLGEVGLDFSMMAPLPDDRQRPGEHADPGQIGDLLGIAPGASYRLVVPASNAPGGQGGNFLSDIDGVFLAAANQTPKPDVITASLGQGFDVVGFPGRYLEDDPLTESVIATIVNADNIVVCISANDGMRTFTPTAVGISGGSAATNVTTDLNAVTNLNDLAYSTAPSLDIDSGAIDVGGTTLNDIFSAPPHDPKFAALSNQLAFPETRYNGGQNLSSGFGSRVNLSAPADNVVAINKAGMRFDDVALYNEGGTSASAPEVAAAAAVALQVARLTNHPFASARAVRDHLIKTATPVRQPMQADAPLNVGPQVSVRRAVEQLLANAGITVKPSVQRIAIAQRRVEYPLASFDSLYFTSTNPGYISLAGIDYHDGNGPDGSGLTDYLTLAPDWQGVPANASYALTVQGKTAPVLASAPFARLLPATLLAAAFPGQAIASSTTRIVKLTYRASVGLHVVAQANFELTFGPTNGTSAVGFAPIVPGVVTGTSFPVTYDLRNVRQMTNPTLVITEPGRFAPSQGIVLNFSYAQPISQSSGTVTVPTSALPGAGLYGIGILATAPSGAQVLTDFATFRFQDAAPVRPPAPLLNITGDLGLPGHSLLLPLGAKVDVAWDVTSVPNATGALLEVSAPGPTLAGIVNTFNNPNGSIPDNDGVDTGSVKVIQLPGTSGKKTFKGTDLGLNSTMFQTLRVLAMSGVNPAAEGGEVSSISMEGQTNSIGGYMDRATYTLYNGGFGVNPNGGDGVMSSTIRLSNGRFETIVDSFDQATHKTTPLVGVVGNAPWYMPGGNYYASGSGGAGSVLLAAAMYSDQQLNTQYGLIAPADVPPVGPLPTLGLPAPSMAIWQTSYNPSSPKAAVLLYTPDKLPWTNMPVQIASLDTSTQTFGPLYNTAVNSNGPGIYLLAADMGLNKALIAREDAEDWTGSVPASYDLIDLGSGLTTNIPSTAQGIGSALAVDEQTHMAMMPSFADDTLVILNEQTGLERKVTLPSTAQAIAHGYSGGLSAFSPQFIAADPVNHLFLVYVPFGNGVFSYDYNTTSPLYVFDETGNVVKTISGWAHMSFGDVADTSANFLQVNGSTRTAYLLAGSQLALINY